MGGPCNGVPPETDMFESLLSPVDDPGRAHWAPLRRAPRECDNALNGTARHWLRGLPPRRRPLRLCETYPRVANRIAWCWADAALTEQVLDDLLTDRRGGRRGFPAPIARELQRLRAFNTQHRAENGHEGILGMVGRVAGLG
jgi:hypothetical protein